jgi:hypothetical protein
MAINLTVNGTVFSFPEKGDAPNSSPAVDWGVTATQWASAVTAGMLQKSGGAFALTAEVDFGASFGVKSIYYKSRAASPASAGIVRLGNDESISWRDNADSGDLSLKVNASDQLVFDGVDLQPLTTRGDIIYRNASGQNVRLAVGSSGQVLKSDGTDISWGTVAGSGDVVGPASATTGDLAVYDGTTGKLLKTAKRRENYYSKVDLTGVTTPRTCIPLTYPWYDGNCRALVFSVVVASMTTGEGIDVRPLIKVNGTTQYTGSYLVFSFASDGSQATKQLVIDAGLTGVTFNAGDEISIIMEKANEVGSVQWSCDAYLTLDGAPE